MKTISSLPKDFFEPVSFYPLDHRAGKFNISTDNYFVFGHEDKFRGIKKAFDVDKPPFYLLHEETFKVAKNVFWKLFNAEPDLLTVFHDVDKTWNAFIIGSSKDVQYEQEDKHNEFSDLMQLKSVDERTDEAAILNKDFLHFPLIGGFNNYGFDKTPAFFYLIATPFGESSGSVLAVDNFRFSKDEEKLPFVLADRQNALDQLVKNIAKRFEAAQLDFEQLLESISGKKVIGNIFAPVVLDLYNRNRNLQSILNDDQLRHRVKRLYLDAKKFTDKRIEISWSEFIHFIVRYNQFYFEKTLLLEGVEELFSRKDSYRKFDRLFRQFLIEPDRFSPYVDNQVSDWKRIEKIVLNMPSMTNLQP